MLIDSKNSLCLSSLYLYIHARIALLLCYFFYNTHGEILPLAHYLIGFGAQKIRVEIVSKDFVIYVAVLTILLNFIIM